MPSGAKASPRSRNGENRVRARLGAICALVLAVAASIVAAAPGAVASGKGPHGLNIRSAGASGSGPLVNHGGPVESAPKGYVVYWGWASDPSGEQSYLNAFLSDVGGSSWLATVAQYGGGSQSGLLGGTWSDSLAVPSAPSDAQIQAEGVRAANHFGTGTSVNVEILVATPTGHSTPGFGSQWCAYHGKLGSLPNVTYTELPYITDAGSNCGRNSVNAGSAGTLDGVGIVEGHELAETITDPLLNAWYDSTVSEIGDKCAWVGLGDVTLSGRSFAMQPLWSNAVNGCTMSTVSGPAVNNPGPQDSFQYDQASLQMTATGGAPPYRWSAVGLPNGLSINSSTGYISGVFLTHAPYLSTVTATDSAGHSGSVTFSWYVECC